MTAAVAVASMLGAIAVVSTAHAATISLAGVVHGPNGKPMAGVTVSAMNFSYNVATVDVSTKTSSTGTFSFASVSASDETLAFGATSTTFYQYLGGTTNPQEVTRISVGLDGAADRSWVMATLSPSGTISGKVSKLPSGGVAGYSVRAYRQDFDGNWALDMTAKTSSSGTYTLAGLEPGAYHLQAIDLTSAHPAYGPVYSGGASDIADASSVGVVASKTSSYNFTVAKPGSISGTVTGLHGVATEKLGGVHVTPYRLTGTPGSFTSAEAKDSPSTVTSSTGAYSLTGLAPGYYTLEFNPPAAAPFSPSGTHYGRNFLGGGDSATAASYVQIGNGTAVTNQNIQLQGTATITGTVFDAANPTDPLSDIRVMADYTGRDADLPSEHAQVTHTADDGTFTISDLGPGTYDLYVGSNASTDSNWQSENTGWVRQIYNVPGPLVSGSSTPVTIDLNSVGNFGFYTMTAPQVSTTSATVGDTVSVNTGVYNATDISYYTYQWLSDGSVVNGATSSTYTLRPSDANEYVTALVTPHSFGWGKLTANASNGVHVGYATLAQTSPAASISGTNAVGQTLTVDPGGWNADGTVFTYVWQVSTNGTLWNAVGNGGTSYTLTGADYETGPNVSVRVQMFAMKPGYQGVDQLVTEAGSIASSTMQMVKAPTVKKTSAGFTLGGGTWIPSTVNSDTTNWTVTKPDGTITTYPAQAVLTLAEAGTNYVTATEHRAANGYADFDTDPIVAQLGASPVPSGTNLLVGTPQVAAPVTAPNPTWLPSAGTSTYQWQYELGTTWKSIGGATSATYDPTASYAGRLLRVITTRTLPGYHSATLVTTAKTKVALGAAPGIVTPRNGFYHGTGDTATVAPSWSPTPTSMGYQWEYAASASGPWTKISGATKSAYFVAQSLVNKYLQVVLTASIAGHVTGVSNDLVGQVLPDQFTLLSTPKVTASNGVYTVSNVSFSPAVAAANVQYHWYYYDQNDASPSIGLVSTAASQNLAASAHPGAHWAVLITVPFSGGYSYNGPSTPNILVKKGSLAASGAITLPASKVGTAIVPPTITWAYNSPTLAYQWQYESGTTWVSIASSSGGRAATYTPGASLLGHHIRVVTTASKTNYNSATVTSSVTTPTLGDAPVAGTGGDAPQLSGYGIGATWTALPGTWNMTGLAFHYQWAFSTSSSGPWTAIPNATSSKYTVPADLLHDYLQATISASKSGYNPGNTTVQSAALQNGVFTLKTAPMVTHTGSTYTVTSNGVWSPATTVYDYDWEVFDPATDSSQPVSTTNSYTTQASDAGKVIQVTVYPDASGFNSLGDTITVQQGAKIAPTSPITLTGTPVVGNDLTLNVPGWNTLNPFVAVTWYRGGVATGTNINSFTYPLTTADLGKAITAKVVASKDGYPSATFTFGSTATYSNVVLAPTTAPSITTPTDPLNPGEIGVGSVVTASPGAWNTSGLTFGYQWTRDGVAIPGATSSTYVLAATDLGAEVSATVTASRAYYTSASASTQSITVELGPQIKNSVANPIKVTGTAQLGKALTLTLLDTWSRPVTVQTQWEYSTDNGATWSYPWGATGLTYTLSAADGLTTGCLVRVAVFATAPGYSEFGEDGDPITVVP